MQLNKTPTAAQKHFLVVDIRVPMARGRQAETAAGERQVTKASLAQLLRQGSRRDLGQSQLQTGGVAPARPGKCCGPVPWPVKPLSPPALLRLSARPSSTEQPALSVPSRILLCTFILTHNGNCICVHLLCMTTEGAPRREQTTRNTRSSIEKNNRGTNINRQKKEIKKSCRIQSSPLLLICQLHGPLQSSCSSCLLQY